MTEEEKLFNDCVLDRHDIAAIHGVRPQTMIRWIYGRCQPSKKNQLIYAKIINFMYLHPKMEYHPSYGYATQDQINKIKSIGLGPLRDIIIGDIRRQNADNGKLSYTAAKLMGYVK